MNPNLLRAAIASKGLKQVDVIKAIGCTYSGWGRRMQGATEFTRSEINEIYHFLQLTKEELTEIFFTAKVKVL